MNDLIEHLNSLSGIRAKITDAKTIENLEVKIKSTAKPFDINCEINDLGLSELSGVYYIEALFPFKTAKALDDFGGQWGKGRSKNELSVGISRYYKSRAQKHTKAVKKNEYIPFYLGKATNIKQRVIEHLCGSSDSNTYSLKLKSRPEIIKDLEFKISYIALNINADAYFGVELLERELRKVLNPIIGKQ